MEPGDKLCLSDQKLNKYKYPLGQGNSRFTLQFFVVMKMLGKISTSTSRGVLYRRKMNTGEKCAKAIYSFQQLSKIHRLSVLIRNIYLKNILFTSDLTKNP